MLKMSLSDNSLKVLGLAVLLVAAYFSVGYYQFDEHFQILEFAGLKLNLAVPDSMPWEYYQQMRPALQPALVVLLYDILSLVGIENPFTVALVLRLLSALLTFTCMWSLYEAFRDEVRDPILKRWFLILSFLLWFAVFVGVRYSSESWSGAFFAIAVALYLLRRDRNVVSSFFLGIVLGAAVVVRFQVVLLILGFLAWIALIRRERFRNLALLISGIAVCVGIGILIDRWFYGRWTISAWNYFEQNILLNKVSTFGTTPWWWYLKAFFLKAIPPFSLLFILAVPVLLFRRPKSPVLWSILPFLAVHFIIGHKEIRFLFPIVYFCPVILITACETIQNRHARSFSRWRSVGIAMRCFFIVNILCLSAVALRPADSLVPLYEKIYKEYPGPTVLYCLGQNPYHRVLDVFFYKRKNLSIDVVQSANEVRPRAGYANLVAVEKRKELFESENGTRLVYSSYPDWVYRFNFNHWIERSKIWYVYELTGR